MENLLISIFEFIYNNIVTFGIIVTSLTLVTITLRLVYLEYRFNQKLSVKKIFFGERRTFKVRRFTARRIFALVLAVLLISLILVQAYGNPISYQTNTVSVNSQSDVEEIYESFYEKFFSNPFDSNLETPLDDDIAFKDVQSETFDGLDFTVDTPRYVYVLNRVGIQTLVIDDQGASYQGSTVLDNPACEIERVEPHGMTLIDDKLVVVGVKSYGQCVSSPAPYSLRDTETIVYVYDTAGPLMLEETYTVRGYLTDMSVQGGALLLSTNTWVPFATDNFDINDYLPYVIENNRQRETLLQNIPYIEGSTPNAFVTLAKIDINTTIIDSESVLTDYQNEVYFRDDAVIVMVDRFNFNQASDVFEFRDPIDSIDTSIIQLNHFDDDIYYFRTQVVPGERVTNDALFFVEEGVKVFTRTSQNTNLIHYFTDMLRYDLERELDFSEPIQQIVFEQNHFYIKTSADQLNYYIYRDFANGETVQVANQNEGYFGDLFFSLSSNRHLAVRVFDNNRINYEIYDQLPDSFLYNLSYLIREDYTDINVDIEQLNNASFSYVERESLLLIPTYRLADNQELVGTNRLIDIYHLTRIDNQVETLNMRTLGAFSSPFNYRVIALDDYLIHITPGGFILTDIDDVTDITQTVFFPNP